MPKFYDIPLRKLVKDIPVNFLKLVFGKDFKNSEVKFLDVKLSKLFEREADLIIETKGEIYHLEIQSFDDPKMALRMLYYYALIYENYGKIPNQAVVYIGNKPLRKMKKSLKLPHLSFDFELVDLNTIDCNLLLESQSPEDWIISVLCNIKNEEKTLKELLNRFLILPADKRQKYLSLLLHIAKLRPKRLNFLKREVEKMPITIDLEKDPFYLEGVERTKKEVAIKLYKKLKLDIKAIAEILNISPKQIEKWFREEGLETEKRQQD